MVSGAASTLVNVGVVGFTAGVATDIATGARRKRKGKRGIAPTVQRRSITRFNEAGERVEQVTNVGTKRFPRGRLVILSDAVKGKNIHVVLGTATPVGRGKGRKLIIINRGVQRSSFVTASEIAPITIRRDVLGLPGKGSVKPRVTGSVSQEKVKKAVSMTQRTLDRL